VASHLQTLEAPSDSSPAITEAAPRPPVEISVSLLTGGQDKHYSLGLTKALLSQGLSVEVIGSEEVDDPALHSTPEVTFLNLRGNRRANVGLIQKVSRVFVYYSRLVRYALTARPEIFHILWNNKLEYIDRTVLILFYKLCGKKIVFTAHNVNKARRDATDSFLNRLTLRIQYRLVDHIFVHTEKMRDELNTHFGVPDRSVTVLVHPLNVAVPKTVMTSAAAKVQLGIRNNERTILFFGAIAPYKGLDLLVTAFQQLVARNARYRLIIAGRPKEGECEGYWKSIQATISRTIGPSSVIQDIEYVSDDKVEVYFKAADVLALPYREIFQSGILFLAYSYGLPVVAADVGSFRETLVEGKTGFLCRPHDPNDLCKTLEEYFISDLFTNLGEARERIREHALSRHSWVPVGQLTRNVYAQLLRSGPS